jgi:hypothetical protein
MRTNWSSAALVSSFEFGSASILHFEISAGLVGTGPWLRSFKRHRYSQRKSNMPMGSSHPHGTTRRPSQFSSKVQLGRVKYARTKRDWRTSPKTQKKRVSLARLRKRFPITSLALSGMLSIVLMGQRPHCATGAFSDGRHECVVGASLY